MTTRTAADAELDWIATRAAHLEREGFPPEGALAEAEEEAASSEHCEVCGGLNDLGDEPGEVHASGRWVTACSVACTEAALARTVARTAVTA
jgi:hypothetical protein